MLINFIIEAATSRSTQFGKRLPVISRKSIKKVLSLIRRAEKNSHGWVFVRTKEKDRAAMAQVLVLQLKRHRNVIAASGGPNALRIRTHYQVRSQKINFGDLTGGKTIRSYLK